MKARLEAKKESEKRDKRAKAKKWVHHLQALRSQDLILETAGAGLIAEILDYFHLEKLKKGLKKLKRQRKKRGRG